MHQQTLDPPLKLWEWFWTIYARACFWNKHYHWPYGGLSERKTRILMTLRGESLDAEHTHDDLPVYSCGHDECGRPGPAREETIKSQTLGTEKVKGWLDGKEPKKIIYVKGKLVSFVL